MARDSENLADVHEGKWPVRPLGCDPFGGLRRIAMRHAAVDPPSAAQGVLEDRRHERHLGKAYACSVGRKIRSEDDVVGGGRGVTSRVFSNARRRERAPVRETRTEAMVGREEGGSPGEGRIASREGPGQRRPYAVSIVDDRRWRSPGLRYQPRSFTPTFNKGNSLFG